MGCYNFLLNMDADDTNPKLINWMFANAEVLEFGAANGRMTKYLSESMQCKIDIVEIDNEAGKEAEKYARTACIGLEEGNVEKEHWEKKFSECKYDFIVFADVLEHLFNPADVLERCKKFLKPTGKILVSIPNMANNAIIYQLLNDDFQYKDTGLLDKTHVHFFTLKTFRSMVTDLGFSVVKEDAVYRQIDETEFGIRLDDIEEDYREALAKHETGIIYQGLFQLSLSGQEKCEPIESRKNVNEIFFSKLYYRRIDDTEFSEENSIVKKRNNANNVLEFDINKTISQLCFNPMNVPGIIRIEEINIYDELGEKIDISEKVTNGRCLENGIYVFSTNMPQILLENINCYIKKVTITFEVLSYAVRGMEHVVGVIDKYESEKQELFVEKEKVQENCRNELESKNHEIEFLYSGIEALNKDIKRLNKDIENVSKEYETLQERYNTMASTIFGKIYLKF